MMCHSHPHVIVSIPISSPNAIPISKTKLNVTKTEWNLRRIRDNEVHDDDTGEFVYLVKSV